MGDDRPVTYVDEVTGMVIYRASGTGNCIKGLVASRLGVTPEAHPDWLLEKFDQGNRAEPIILKRFTDETGWKLLDPHDATSYKDLGGMVCREAHDNQFTLEIPVGSKVLIRCHLDGIGYCYADQVGEDGGSRVGETRVVEVKAFAQSTWDKYVRQGIMAFPYYSTQLAIQMYGTGLGAVFIVALKDEDGELTDQWKIDYFDEPPVNMGAIKAKVAKVEGYVARGEMPGCDWNQYPCQYYFLHDEPEVSEPTELGSGVESDMFDTACQEYVKGQALEKEGKALKKKFGDIIKKWFDDAGKKGEKVETGRYRVTDVVMHKDEYVMPAYEMRYPKITPIEKPGDDDKDGGK